nr:hypothetical protein [Kibdelosporangium sp. MJ126-NF4]CEL16574.1 hypothetical protein [Kibdelosporangium sp. MJ126-NF4]CTQ89075.1 hypothetical protein [Kibdelosporangium sp. MJ126-NF4]
MTDPATSVPPVDTSDTGEGDEADQRPTADDGDGPPAVDAEG